jgi:putative flippase GtrA
VATSASTGTKAVDRQPGQPGGRPVGRFRGMHRDPRVAFVGVGAVNTVLGTAFFVGLELTLGRVAGYLVVLVVAHVLSVLCAFVLHRRLVFRVRGNVLLDLGRFELVYIGGLGANMVLLPLMVEVGGLPVIAAQLIVVAIMAPLSYLAHRHFSFRRSTSAARRDGWAGWVRTRLRPRV